MVGVRDYSDFEPPTISNVECNSTSIDGILGPGDVVTCSFDVDEEIHPVQTLIEEDWEIIPQDDPFHIVLHRSVPLLNRGDDKVHPFPIFVRDLANNYAVILNPGFVEGL